MLTTVKDLTGYTLQSRDGEIGKVKEFYFDDRHWAVRYLVVDTGNWLKERRVLISPYALLSMNEDKRQVAVDLTKKQIEGSPSLENDKPVSQQFEESYYEYYGWPVYWYGSYTWGNESFMVPHPEIGSKNRAGKSWNPHLRSYYAVQGYHIQAKDGEIGHVEDYILHDETWKIRYLVVDTRNWLPGRKVLISPKWIERVSWDEMKVIVNLNRETVKESPEYTGKKMLSRDYEGKLHGHYNRVGYWVEKVTT